MNSRPEPPSTTTPALDALVDELRSEFRRDARGTRIAELLGAYAREQDDWRPFALFSEERYTRNLVAREDAFELLILCWNRGQESPIHNHEGQDCWMSVLSGEIEELRYCTPEQVQPGPLKPRGSQIYSPGEVAFIRDDIGLHLVRSARPSEKGVSLHLYAAPYDSCSCYCPDTGKITRIEFTNHSVRGRILSV